MGSKGATKRTGTRVLNEPETAPVRERPFDGKEHIQGIGDVPARKIKNLEAGDILLFNYGYTYVVKSITPIGSSGKSATLTMVNSETGKEYSRRVRMETKYAVADQEAKSSRERTLLSIRMSAAAHRG